MPPFASRRAILKTLAASLACAGLPDVFGQAEAPLRLVVTFPPGGSTDITARIVQPELQKRVGRPVVVENKPGAASQIGTEYVARSKPDGNTLLVCFDTHAINPIVKTNLPYDTFKDFVGVSLAVRFPLVIGAHPSAPGHDLKEFLAAAQRQPGKFSYASTGVGSLNHLAAEDLKRRSAVDLLHVPFNGGGPAVTAVVAKTATLTMLSYAALKGQIASGKIKALAVTGAQRLPDLPDVPTVAESGFPGFEVYSWIGIFAPSATPPPTVSKLSEEFQASLRAPEVSKALTDAGFEVMATDGPALDKYAREQYERWSEFVKRTGLKVEE